MHKGRALTDCAILAPEKKMADKSRFGPELTEAESDALVDNVVDLGVFNKTIILLGGSCSL